MPPLLADGLVAVLQEHPVNFVHGRAERVLGEGLVAELLEERNCVLGDEKIFCQFAEFSTMTLPE